jgi:hypothetical protein
MIKKSPARMANPAGEAAKQIRKKKEFLHAEGVEYS